MKILVYPHDLGMGGSQLNAIELAAATRDLGHEVVVYGQPGVLNGRIDELGLMFIQSPAPGRRPSLKIARDLRRVARERSIDVLHGYEWPPTLEARMAVAGTSVVCVSTVMSMAVAPFIPRHIPLVVGTEQIAAAERAAGRRHVTVIEPPVDTRHNAPGLPLDVQEFRRRHGIPFEGRHVVCVTRLARELKLEGLLVAIAQLPHLADDLTLTIVGDGPARAEVSAAADRANASAGRRAVVLTGEVSDPRPAYEMANVVLGMGGSALRAMAFAKPLVVQGELGFWKLLTPDTLGEFLWAGWFGIGSGAPDGPTMLRSAITPLLENEERRRGLGQFGRQLVVDRYSLEAAAARQTDLYGKSSQPRDSEAMVRSDLQASAELAKYKGRRAWARLRQAESLDDFNAVALGRALPTEARDETTSTVRVVYFAGVPYDSLEGTDHRLVTHLSRRRDVVWVDPIRPFRLKHYLKLRLDGESKGLRHERRGLYHVRVLGPPGVYRPGLASLGERMLLRRISKTISQSGASPDVICANPLVRLGRVPGRTKLLLMTDDYIAGSALMGLPVRRLQAVVRANLAQADVVLAVSPVLYDELQGQARDVRLLPNGCELERFELGRCSPASEIRVPRPRAGVIGQINERLDIDALLQVAEGGISLVMVGPRAERTADLTSRVDRLLSYSNVQWTGLVPFSRIPEFAAALDVGITPYTESEFNRASFPLKTLEYLAAGLPVVSTDLASTRWLDSPYIRIVSGNNLCQAIDEVVSGSSDLGTPAMRRAFAANHSWNARVDQLLSIINEVATAHTGINLSGQGVHL